MLPMMSLSPRSSVTRPSSGAVHEYQTVPSTEPSGHVGSPAWAVAPTLSPLTDACEPVSTPAAAKSSFAGGDMVLSTRWNCGAAFLPSTAIQYLVPAVVAR